jgi:SHS2 domain-containing protein
LYGINWANELSSPEAAGGRDNSVRYEVIDHTADFGIRVFGTDAKDLFANAGRVLFGQITDTASLGGGETVSLEVAGSDWPDLMVNWLRELLYLWSGKGLLIRDIDVEEICETRVAARLRGECFDPNRHAVKSEIKAVTYHQIAVTQGADEWWATVIFDV